MLEELVADATAGDPMTGIKWTRKTAQEISGALAKRGYEVGPDTVRRLLHLLKYALRSNRKRLSKKTGLKITEAQKAQINLSRGRVLPRWNYTIRPHTPTRKTEK